MKRICFSSVVLIIVLMFASLAFAQDYETQIKWSMDSDWSAIASSYDIGEGVAPANPHASKLGEQHHAFQMGDQFIIFTFNIATLPYNIAYNLPDKRLKVYTNYYYLRFRAIGGEWSEFNIYDWVAITYVK